MVAHGRSIYGSNSHRFTILLLLLLHRFQVVFDMRTSLLFFHGSLPSIPTSWNSISTYNPTARIPYGSTTGTTGRVTRHQLPLQKHQQQQYRLYQAFSKDGGVLSSLSLSNVRGEYAGHLANFDAKTGKLIPVPDHLVPDSLIEWEAVPETLEVLTSDEIRFSEDEVVLDRVEVQVMPEVGCGLDNLDTMIKKTSLVMKEGSGTVFSSDSLSFATCIPNNSKVLPPVLKRDEPYFTVDCVLAQKHDDDEDDSNNDISRYRILFNVLPNSPELFGQISVTKERRTSSEPTSGAISVGGGLDARTVTRLIGGAKFSTYESDMVSSNLGNDRTITYRLPENISIVLSQTQSDDTMSNVTVSCGQSCEKLMISFDCKDGTIKQLSI